MFAFFSLKIIPQKGALYKNENPVLSICHLDSIYFLLLEKDIEFCSILLFMQLIP